MPQSPKSALYLSLLDFFLSNGHEFLFNSYLGSLERFAVVEDYWLCFLFITTTSLPKFSKGTSPTNHDFFSCASECYHEQFYRMQLYYQALLNFSSLNLDLKKWAFLAIISPRTVKHKISFVCLICLLSTIKRRQVSPCRLSNLLPYETQPALQDICSSPYKHQAFPTDKECDAACSRFVQKKAFTDPHLVRKKGLKNNSNPSQSVL